MSSQTTITKTEFLEAFKTCNKYLKCNYIEQDQFFNNMVCLMGLAKQYMPDAMNSTLDFFDAGTFRKVIVQLLTTMGPELWRDYGGLSEQMRAEANSHFFAAGTDVMGIAVGSAVGKGVKMATKGGVKMISRGVARGTKTVSSVGRREVANVAKNTTKKATKSKDVLFSKPIGKDRFDFTSEGEVRLHSKTRHSNAGRYVGTFEAKFGGKEVFDIKADVDIDKFMNLQYSMDSTMTLIQNPAAVAINRGVGSVTNMMQNSLTEGSRFSFSDHSVFQNKIVDIGSDFVPIVGNAKAVVSAVTNLAIGYEYSKTAKRIEMLENQNMEADRKFINAYLYVDIERDLNAMDKETLYKMWLFASKLYNQ